LRQIAADNPAQEKGMMRLYMHPASIASRPVRLFAVDNGIELDERPIDLMSGEHARMTPLFCFDFAAEPARSADRPVPREPPPPESLCRDRQSGRLHEGQVPGPDGSNAWVSRSESPYPEPAIAALPGQPQEKAIRMDFLKPRSHRMNRRRRIYEGKAKVLYEGPEPGTLIQYFKDDATAFNAKKHEVIEGKGVLNNRISEYLFQRLNDIGVPTHFIRRINMREQLIREVEIIPLEVVVRNVAAGSLSTRLGLEEGTQLPRSIIEFYYKNDKLNDPMVSEEHITAFGWAAPQEIDDIMALAIRVNDFLSGLFLGVGIRLVDFKIETGRLWEGETMRIVLADEISPDSCRLWDVKTNDKMDKDRFRKDLGGMIEAYTEVARRLGVVQENEYSRAAGPRLVK
jgi:phosphoribosylaminoimidazole-succinocarboxamide synthase